jgi:conjugal transfer pilus assembly protein TraU
LTLYLLRKRLCAIALAFSAVLAFIVSEVAEAQGTPGACTGSFINPVTDVCWSCLFPLSVGGLPIFPAASGRKDTHNPPLPICLCGSPIPRIGIAMGFWEPVRLVDVSVKPWCFVNLGGKRIAPGFDIGYGKVARPRDVTGRGSKWHVHWYLYPLLYWLEVLTDAACLEQASFDIAYVTEVDPLWQDDTLTALINPEVAVFANPVAQAACGIDCVSATADLPLDALFWCAGCQGPMYPINGNVSAHVGHVQASRLALARFAYKMHRQGIAWGTMGSEGLCKKYLMPILKKQQYRVQMVNPSPMVTGRWACPPIGSSDLKPGSGLSVPTVGEDMGYLVWRKRNCCVGAIGGL